MVEIIIIKKIEREPLSIKNQLFSNIINEIINKIDDYSNEYTDRNEGQLMIASFKAGDLLLQEFEKRCIEAGFRSRSHCIRSLMRMFIDVARRKSEVIK